eukprot:Amastigsp_a339356_1127.p2 type:complete len:247 gc:universal Amastigsp_a339356_1127:45-785(+)
MGFASFFKRKKKAALRPSEIAPSKEVSEESSEEHVLASLRETLTRLRAENGDAPGVVSAASLAALCGELGFSGESLGMLVLLRLARATDPNEVPEESLVGLADTLPELARMVAAAQGDISSSLDALLECADFAFTLALEGPSCKVLALSTASVLGNVLASALCSEDRTRTARFYEFLAASGAKGIKRDQFVSWFDFLPEVRACGAAQWAPGSPFPLVFDDYVAWELGQNRAEGAAGAEGARLGVTA